MDEGDLCADTYHAEKPLQKQQGEPMCSWLTLIGISLIVVLISPHTHIPKYDVTHPKDIKFFFVNHM